MENMGFSSKAPKMFGSIQLKNYKTIRPNRQKNLNPSSVRTKCLKKFRNCYIMHVYCLVRFKAGKTEPKKINLSKNIYFMRNLLISVEPNKLKFSSICSIQF